MGRLPRMKQKGRRKKWELQKRIKKMAYFNMFKIYMRSISEENKRKLNFPRMTSTK